MSVASMSQDSIPQLAKDRLMAYMNRVQPTFVFKCGACSKRRKDPQLKDPGWLHIRRTCAQAGSSCDAPPDTARPNFPHYLPGSIVWANYGPTRWPAIVEFAQYEQCDFYNMRLGEDVPYEYFITFIGRDPEWTFGGWHPAPSLRPLLPSQTKDYTPNATLRDALDLCHRYINETLRERLLQLSFIAAELRMTGFGVDDTPEVGANEEVDDEELDYEELEDEEVDDEQDTSLW